MKKLSASLPPTVGERDSPRGRILAALRRRGIAARVELSRDTGLSPAAVSQATAELIGEGVLEELAETDRGEPVRGRPRIMLSFAPSIAAVLGLWVGLDTIELALADARGSRIAHRREAVPLRSLDAVSVTRTLASHVNRFLAQHAAGRRVDRLGVAFQGFVNVTTGTVLWSPVLACQDVPIAADLMRMTGLPTEVDNDASGIAYGLAFRHETLRVGRVACMMVGDGVGLGILLNGEVYRGAHSGGSEFGHVRLGPEGPQCRCGARGCVEAYLADYAIYRDAQAISDLPPPSGGRLPDEADMKALVDRARMGEAGIIELLARAGRMLAVSAGMLIHLLEPDELVICGPALRAKSFLAPAFLSEIERVTIPQLRRLTRIRLLEDDPSLLTEGVILRALQRVDDALAWHGPAHVVATARPTRDVAI